MSTLPLANESRAAALSRNPLDQRLDLKHALGRAVALARLLDRGTDDLRQQRLGELAHFRMLSDGGGRLSQEFDCN